MTAAAPVVAVLAITFPPSSFDRPYRPGASPLDLSGFGGPLLVIHQLAFGVANFAVVAGAVSLMVRFRRAVGTERLQLRWVALAAAVVLLGSMLVLAALTLGTNQVLLGWVAGVDLAILPVVAGATLAVAAVFQPARHRIQQAVDRRFNRRRYGAAKTIAAFSTRLRRQVDLDTLTVELLDMVDQTMQPDPGGAVASPLRQLARTPVTIPRR